MNNDEYLKHLKRWNEKIFEGDGTLNPIDEKEVDTLIKWIEMQKKYLDFYQFEFEKVKMYNSQKSDLLKVTNPSEAKETIISRASEDERIIDEAKSLVKENEILRDYMFGYPANLFRPDPIEKRLREEEARLPYMNNCGDSSPETRGNYVMDSKVYEQKILNIMYDNLNVKKEDYWGYITSGGTEGNFWGIRTGFELYPQGRLYFSSSTHYSVPKYVRLVDNKQNPESNVNIFKNTEIESNIDGTINAEKLIQEIVSNYSKDKTPAILVLNWGTTVVGAVDNVKYITDKLNELGIPHYVHLDAALFGGIPKNQTNAPSIKDLDSLGVDSVSISLHKYIGSNMTNGVLICKKDILKRKNNLQIEYIGQEDPTYLGSRSVLPLTTYYKMLKLYERTFSEEYENNIEFFKKCADEKGLPYEIIGNSNIIVVNIYNSDIQHKYQLATFGENNEKAHIILFPYHKKEVIMELVDDLVKVYNKHNGPTLKLK